MKDKSKKVLATLIIIILSIIMITFYNSVIKHDFTIIYGEIEE